MAKLEVGSSSGPVDNNGGRNGLDDHGPATLGADQTPSRTVSDGVAIVGMAMRLPGGVRTAEGFWDFLAQGKDGRCVVPPSRYNVGGWYDDSGKTGAVATQVGHYLQEDIGHFDTEFFNIPPEKAAKMDLQQRLLLEVVWECMENAGQTDWQGTDIACYVGTFGEDWMEAVYKDPQSSWSGKAVDAMDFATANRISHVYDLRGPSMTMRTACSSSMVALDAACRAVLDGQCPAAIVAGSSLLLSPSLTMSLSQDELASPTGTSKPFDAGADGFARGEAINAILIKRVDEAVRNNDPVRAIVRSTATNFDGRTANIMTPNPEAQERLMRDAYSAAGIDNACQTAYIECHATGTPVGDHLEAEAVARMFGKDGITMGSVKSNVGHAEGASAITSLIKAILCLEQQQIPPTIHFSRPHPKIPLDTASLQIATKLQTWPPGRHARVSVNSFGIGGVNAHAIIEAAQVGKPVTSAPRAAQLLVFSAHTTRALRMRDKQLRNYVEHNATAVADIAYTLNNRRDNLKYKSFMVTHSGALQSTDSQEAGEGDASVAFIFTGQGAQWAGMGAELLQTFEVFAESIRKMDETLQSLPDRPPWRILDKLADMKGKESINGPELAQTLSTALQIAVVDLLADWNIHPAAAVGHSSGEVAAAYAAKALTAEEAIIIAYYRGQTAKLALRFKRQKGGMAAVGLSYEELQPYLGSGVTMACENSPSSITISGDREALSQILERIRDEKPGTVCRMLRVDIAYHSAHMKVLGPIYECLLDGRITSKKPRIALYSSLKGHKIREAGELDGRYWREHMENPVLFKTSTTALLENERCTIISEIGPHSALAGPFRQILASVTLALDPRYVPAIVRGKPQTATLMNLAGVLYSHGTPVNLIAINGDDRSSRVVTDLPLYPWQHEARHWEESRIVRDWKQRVHKHHELLGSRVLEGNDVAPVWRNIIRLADVPWLRHHQVDQSVVFPCAGYVATVGEAVRQLSGSSSYSIRHLVVRRALIVPEGPGVELFTTLEPVRLTDDLDSSWYRFTVSSSNGSVCARHCSGEVLGRPSKDTLEEQHIGSYARHVPSSIWYGGARRLGINYGPDFQGLRNISADPIRHIAAATTHVAVDHDLASYAVHPTLIDQCLQVCMLAACHGIPRRIAGSVVPDTIDEIHIEPTEKSPDVQCESTISADGSILADITAATNGKLAMQLQQVWMKRVDLGDDLNNGNDNTAAAELTWDKHVDLNSCEDMMRPVLHREGKLAAEKLAVLCTIESASQTQPETATAPHLARFQDWLHSQCAWIATGQYAAIPGAEDWLKLDSRTRRGLIDDLAAECGQTAYAPIANGLLSIFENIEDLLSGRVHGLEVLSNNDNLTKIYDAIRETMDLGRYFTCCGRSNPSLRVLEIGAGTGGTTATALESLVAPGGARLYSEYCFTDVSAGFFPAARERFAQYDNISYQVLDVSADPIEQGFPGEAYDLIIAANVLHATPSLFETLSNTRKLLAPGGRLFLQELCGNLVHVSYLMGSLPGWWLGEADNRAVRPYVSPERWDYELRRAGLTGTDIVVYDDDVPYQQQAHIVSKVAASTAPRANVTLLYDCPVDQAALEIEKAFMAQGYKVTWCAQGQPLPEGAVISLLDLRGPFLHDILPEQWTSFQNTLTSWTSGSILHLTRKSQLQCKDPRYGLVQGLARTIRSEMSIPFATLEVDQFTNRAFEALIAVHRYVQHCQALNVEEIDNEYLLMDDAVLVPRYVPANLTQHLVSLPDPNGPRRLQITKQGLLDSLVWQEGSPAVLGPGDIELRPHYVGLNFRDLLVAMGIVSDTSSDLGLEASGIVSRVGPDVQQLKPGDQAMVAANGGCFASSIVVSEELCVKLPDGMSLEQAATVPCVFATAIHCLMQLVTVEKGQTVLIHSAAGGVGQAAIQVCQSAGAKIFATVGSDERADYLTSTFNIPRNHIFNSRTTEFLDGVMCQTQGAGVDFVLNSLSGELLHASWKCVASFGTMLEIGKRDLLGHGALSMKEFLQNRKYIGVDLSQCIKERPAIVQGVLQEYIRLHMGQSLKPISPIHTFDAANVQDAFRYMQKGNHIGKIVVKMPAETEVIAAAPTRRSIQYSGDVSYLLIGGLGGIGRSIATWMVENGARHLVFLSRSAGRSESDVAFLAELTAQGATVTPVAGDVGSYEDVQRAIGMASKPVAGVLQLSLVLTDQSITKMGHDQWLGAITPKVAGTWNLHRALADTKLDFFVLIASTGALRGSAGQANYAAANTFLNAFVDYRHAMDLPASVINLGVVDEVGFVARNPFALEKFQRQGVHILSQQQVLDTLHLSICHQYPDSSSGESSSTLTQLNPGFITRPTAERLPFKEDTHVAILRNLNKTQVREYTNDSHLQEFLFQAAADSSVLTHPTSFELILTEISQLFCNLLSLPMDSFDTTEPVSTLGIDSLVSIEIRRWWRHQLGLEISVLEIRNAGSVVQLAQSALQGLMGKFC